jgi:hypothetical protein
MAGRARAPLLLALAGLTAGTLVNSYYAVAVTQRALGPGGGSVISHANGSSAFLYNFNAAYWTGVAPGAPDGLVLRVQNVTLTNQSVNKHSGIAAVRRLPGGAFERVDASRLIVRCPGMSVNGTPPAPTADAPCGDDPRVAWSAVLGKYIMTWQNVSDLVAHRVTHLATTATPWDVASWEFHGPMLPGLGNTSGTSLLLRDDVPGSPHYAFTMQDDDAGHLTWATAPHDDPLSWTVGGPWIAGRPGHWDFNGLASGPQAERLSDGNYLYLYSIDNRRGCESAACGVCGVNCSAPGACPFCRIGRCSLGWVILDGTDPLKVVARAEEPIAFAELPFETVGSPGAPTQTPFVIFTDGLQKVAPDEFVAWYGAGDTNVGAVRFKVVITHNTNSVVSELL